MAEENGTTPTEQQQKIIKQIEFYFGDINLGRDKFLQQQIKDNEDGWVSLETMIKFNRLAKLSTDLAEIATAVKQSKSDLLEVSEDNTKVRRCPDKPVPENNKERKDDLLHRTVYAKGFPLDATLDQCCEFFEKYGKVEFVQMRKDIKKNFKGSCFTTYVSTDAAKTFLNADSVKYGDEELVRYSKEGYFNKKSEEKKQKKEADVKQKEEELKKREEEEKDRFIEKITRGAILEITKLPDNTAREQIKSTFEPHCKVAWVDFDKGEEEARIRFDEVNGAQTAWDKAKEAGGGKVEINGGEVEGKALEGDEELTHWRTVFKAQREKRDQKRGKRKGGRGGRSSGGPRRKQAKAEDDEDDDGSGADSEDESSKGSKRVAEDEKPEGEPASKQSKAETD